ncbi:MAG: hypothetical protein ACXW6V_03050, partial [Candidatus Binatia bacterium]
MAAVNREYSDYPTLELHRHIRSFKSFRPYRAAKAIISQGARVENHLQELSGEAFEDTARVEKLWSIEIDYSIDFAIMPYGTLRSGGLFCCPHRDRA